MFTCSKKSIFFRVQNLSICFSFKGLCLRTRGSKKNTAPLKGTEFFCSLGLLRYSFKSFCNGRKILQKTFFVLSRLELGFKQPSRWQFLEINSQFCCWQDVTFGDFSALCLEEYQALFQDLQQSSDVEVNMLVSLLAEVLCSASSSAKLNFKSFWNEYYIQINHFHLMMEWWWFLYFPISITSSIFKFRPYIINQKGIRETDILSVESQKKIYR